MANLSFPRKVVPFPFSTWIQLGHTSSSDHPMFKLQALRLMWLPQRVRAHTCEPVDLGCNSNTVTWALFVKFVTELAEIRPACSHGPTESVCHNSQSSCCIYLNDQQSTTLIILLFLAYCSLLFASILLNWTWLTYHYRWASLWES